MTTPTAASLLHLIDRAERGSLLAEEAQQLRNGIRVLGQRQQSTASHVDVQGRCPACGGGGLFLGSGGYVTCPHVDCPAPDAASDLLAEQQPATPPVHLAKGADTLPTP